MICTFYIALNVSGTFLKTYIVGPHQKYLRKALLLCTHNNNTGMFSWRKNKKWLKKKSSLPKTVHDIY